MLDNKGFDIWAGAYDRSIAESKGYPFEGYYDVLRTVHDKVEIKDGIKILDIGIGTGALSRLFYKAGAKVYGIDFSEKMLELAKENMPGGRFYRFDFNCGLPEELKNTKFDYIVSSYAIHHISHEGKIKFICQLKDILKERGKIIIADVAFEAVEDMKRVRERCGEEWDEDEMYMTAEEMLPELKRKGFEAIYSQISACAGIFEIFV